MSLKIKIPLLVLVVATTLKAQNDFLLENKANSPYSLFMAGDHMPIAFAPGRALGGTATGLRLANRINLANPASYTSQDTLSFIFDLGFEGTYLNLTNETERLKTGNFNINHLAFSFKASRYWAGSIGLVPYTRTGYSILLAPTLPDGSDHTVKMGSGGMNRFYAGAAFNVLKPLSVGANFSYVFGDVRTRLNTSFPSADSVSIDYYKEENIVSRGLMWDFGAQYSHVSGKNTLVLGLVYQKETRLDNEENFVDFYGFPRSDSVTLNRSLENTVTTVPAKLGFGFSYTYDNRFLAAFDFTTQSWENALISGRQTSLFTGNSYNIGFQVIPGQKTSRKFFEKVNYRVGGYYYQTPIKVEGTQVNDYAMTFGLGIPYRNTNTMFNLACEVGKRGNTVGNLITENYFKVIFDISFFDFWFYKPKFD